MGINGRMIEKRNGQRRSLFLLTLIFLANALLLYFNSSNSEDVMGTVLYSLNIMTVVLLAAIFAIQARFGTEEISLTGLLVSFLIAIVGTSITAVSLISFVITFGDDFYVSGPVSLVSCLVILPVFAYFIFVRDHF
jgi:hypothetical protein